MCELKIIMMIIIYSDSDIIAEGFYISDGNYGIHLRDEDNDENMDNQVIEIVYLQLYRRYNSVL